MNQNTHPFQDRIESLCEYLKTIKQLNIYVEKLWLNVKETI